MGHLHRPQNITPLVYYPREYYYNRPQTVFGPGFGSATFNDESYVSGGERGSSAYVSSGVRGKVDYEDVI